MATTIITKHGSGAPAAGDLVQGELAVDLTNQTLYSKDSSGNVFKVGDTGGGSPGTFTDLVATNSFTSPGIDDNATSTAITITDDGAIVKDTLKIQDPTRPLLAFGETGTPASATPAYLSYGVASKELTVTSYGGYLDGEITFETGGSTERMRIDSAGNLGIGTTSPTFITGSGLEVQRLSDTATMRLEYTGANAFELSSEVDQVTYNSLSTKPHVFEVASAEKMRISTAGNVGIGTSDPSAGTSNYYNDLVIKNTGAGAGITIQAKDALGYGGLEFRNASGAQVGKLFAEVSSGSLGLETGGVSRVNISAAGNVGIGTSGNPTSTAGWSRLLEVSGTTAATKYTNGSANNGYSIGYTAGDLRIWDEATASWRMTIDALGNVGIGTASPSTSLDIVRAGVEPLRIQSTTSGTVQMRLANTAGNAFINGVGNDIVIPSGNVGIGTDAPAGQFVLSNSGAQELLFSATLLPDATYAASYNRNTAQYLTAVSRASGYDFRIANNASALAISASGNVGIAIEPKPWGTYQTLSINGSGAFYGTAGGSTSSGMSHGCYYDGSTWRYAYTGVGALRCEAVGLGNPYYAWYTADDGAADGAISFSEAMRLNATGNLLVGRTSGSAAATDHGTQLYSTGEIYQFGSVTGSSDIHRWYNGSGTLVATINGRGEGYFLGGATYSGPLKADEIIQDGAPVVDSLQIIRAFMKLRAATADPDSTVEELREKLKTAVDDIIDQFQDQIDNMPTPLED